MPRKMEISIHLEVKLSFQVNIKRNILNCDVCEVNKQPSLHEEIKKNIELWTHLVLFINKNKLRNKTTRMEILLDLQVDIVAINLYYLKPSFLLVIHLDVATLLFFLLFSVSSISSGFQQICSLMNSQDKIFQHVVCTFRPLGACHATSAFSHVVMLGPIFSLVICIDQEMMLHQIILIKQLPPSSFKSING